MPRSHVSTEHEILVAAYKTVTLSRVAIVPVAADLWMKVRVVFINGNSFSAAIAVAVAGGEVPLRDIITAAYLEGGYEGAFIDQAGVFHWDDIHWVSLEADNAFYYNAGASVDGTSMETAPTSSDWTCAANAELRLP